MIDPEQIVTLKQEGVSDSVLIAMLKSGRAESEAALRAESAANNAATQAMRSARLTWPAPIFTPTMVSAALPSANSSGIWM